ncbi:hypothetical protein BLA29_013163 [Euroglyphus maynei]|uniref:Uncharacterized protein n=1 Tax=Euroglyphus maynei TaxID=6958 RepID=A0A1Y3ASR6_EURMA|nr:hypothetical protein BLA29_013163 [Euroglyphus maynei]
MSLYMVMKIHINETLSSISALEMLIFSTSISAIDPVCKCDKTCQTHPPTHTLD